MAESTLPAVDNETKGMLENQVKKGKPRKFILICKGVEIKTLIVFKKGPYGVKITAAKKAGLKGEVYSGIVTGQGISLTFQLPATDEVLEAMKAEGNVCADEKEPCKIAKLREFLQEEADFKSKPEFQFVKTVDAIARVAEEDEEQSSLETGLTKERLIEGLKKTKPFIEKALAAGSARKDEIMSAVGLVKQLIAEGKFEEAQTAMLQLGGLLREIIKGAGPQPQATAPTQPLEGPPTEKQTKKSDWDALLKELTPKLRAFTQFKIGDYKKLGDLLKQAQEAKPTDLDQAIEFLKQCRAQVNEIEVKHRRDYEKVRDENATRFNNAEKHEPIKDWIVSGRADAAKMATELNFSAAVGRLRELIDLIHSESSKIEQEFDKLYDDVIFKELEFERDPNDARKAVQDYLKNWDLVAAAAEVKKFKTEMDRSKRVGFSDLGEIEKRAKDANLQNAQHSRNTAMAVNAAKKLIDDKGNLNIKADLLSDLPHVPAHHLAGVAEEIASSGLDDLPQTVHALEVLKRLETDEEVRKALNNVKAPTEQNGTAANMIRATLGLKQDANVTDADARRAALSALLFQARQGDVGSCFATGTAVQIQRNKPEKFLSDIQEMFSTGKLTRTIQHNGKDYKIESPLNKEMLVSNLEKKTTVPRQGGNLHLAPDMVASLDSLNIKPDDREQVIKEALQDARAREGIAAAMKELGDKLTPEDKVKDVAGEALKILRGNRGLSIKAALKQAISNLGMHAKNADATWCAKKLGHGGSNAYAKSLGFKNYQDLNDKSGESAQEAYAKSLGFANQDEWRMDAGLKKCDSYDQQGGNDAFSPQQILEMVVENKVPADKQEAAKRGANDAFLGQQDNRLMRAWEYTIATMVEKNPAVQTYGDCMKAGLGMSLVEKFAKDAEDYANSKGITDASELQALVAVVGDIAKPLAEKLLKQVDSQYDPSVKTEKQTVAKDGHSSSGGYSLYFKDKRIDSEASFNDMLEDLVNQALAEFNGSGRTAADQKLASQLAKQLISHTKTKAFRDASIANNPKTETDKKASPWTYAEGGNDMALMQFYHDQPTPISKVSTKSHGKPITNAEVLGEFLIDTLKGMKMGDKLAPDKAENAAVPVRSESHAFSLKPGHPTLHTILNGEKTGEQVMAELKANETKKNTKRRGPHPVNNPIDGAVAKVIAQTSTIFGRRSGEVVARMNTRVLGLNVKEISMTDLLTHLRAEVNQSLLDLYSTYADQAKRDPFVNMVEEKMSAALLVDVIPKEEFEPLIDAALEKLKVIDEKRDPAKQAVLKELQGDTITRDELDKLLTKVLKDMGVDSREEQIKAALNQPRGIIIADTNWGDGQHMTQFSMVVNPMTDAVELWKMNEDGTNARPEDQASWVNNKEWMVYNDTAQVGGATGDNAWEVRRGDLRAKVKECVSKRQGNISMMQSVLEIADQKFADGDKAAGEKALDRLDTLVKRAAKITTNVEEAAKALDQFKKAVEKVAIDEAKEAAKFVDTLIKEVKVLRDENGIADFASRRKSDLELLKEGKQHLGVDVDLVTILSKA